MVRDRPRLLQEQPDGQLGGGGDDRTTQNNGDLGQSCRCLCRVDGIRAHKIRCRWLARRENYREAEFPSSLALTWTGQRRIRGLRRPAKPGKGYLDASGSLEEP